MIDIEHIVAERIAKLDRHITAFTAYKKLIDQLMLEKPVFQPDLFEQLKPEEKAIFDAYLKRFASIQDYLGAKIFPAILDLAGIGAQSLSEVLAIIEKEGIIDNLETWIGLREARNHLEHDYPAEMEQALLDLQFCINHYTTIMNYYNNVKQFIAKYGFGNHADS
ncbi:hypothetical protein [Gracilinema caldarium]|uniref:Uncharacterized protein n=1 Tax=Gracilinema caldarium (strain ATCC 51460 / DSM 7334 / H1) TaxID=744872 RepID=F8F2T1_GRAC1|nr:hypothetical protein [Gracilinema caldarium]AEJ19475.1 hypothetical protein Spica_1329 [Gracilinema caldarium DSM 7334]